MRNQTSDKHAASAFAAWASQAHTLAHGSESVFYSTGHKCACHTPQHNSQNIVVIVNNISTSTVSTSNNNNLCFHLVDATISVVACSLNGLFLSPLFTLCSTAAGGFIFRHGPALERR